MSSDEVSEEIEAVTAILDEDTVEVDHDASGCVTEISIKITPLTASEQEKQYVSLTLVVTITEGEWQFRWEPLELSKTLSEISQCPIRTVKSVKLRKGSLTALVDTVSVCQGTHPHFRDLGSEIPEVWRRAPWPRCWTR